LNPLFRILLSPITFIYGLAIGIRNLIYDAKLLKSAEFSLPVINVGNLTVGGEGKTPHVEYLLVLLEPYINIATLSRGYKRKSKGFRFVKQNDKVSDVGDEPLQFKKKYPNNVVAVSESRAIAITEIIKTFPQTQVIILDDAFQHLSVKPGLNILLTSYDKIFVDDYLMPSGRLREFRSAYKRADLIIVSKCPLYAGDIDQEHFRRRINVLDHQKLFFSYYKYGVPYHMYNPSARVDLRKVNVILVSAIANTSYLMDFIETSAEVISTFKFEDHHYFSSHEIGLMHRTLKESEEPNTIILTTEKDATRFHEHRDYIFEHKLPIFILPVKVDFHFEEGMKFDKEITDFLLKFRV